MNNKNDFVFSTGTDEHGSKIQEAAEKHNTPLDKYCQDISSKYKTLFNNCNVNYTNYIRTTDEKHSVAVHSFWVRKCNVTYCY